MEIFFLVHIMNDKTMKEYILFKNNTYNLISIVDARKGSPQKIIELVNNEIAWIAENDIIFIPIKIVIPTISKKNQKLNQWWANRIIFLNDSCKNQVLYYVWWIKNVYVLLDMIK